MKKSKIDEIMYDDNICWPSALFEYLSNNVQYPVVAEENGIQGREIVTFIVEKDGFISNAKVVKSVDYKIGRIHAELDSWETKWRACSCKVHSTRDI